MGSSGQYDFSGGINIDNIVYMGLAVGVQDIYYRESLTWDETPLNNAGYGLNTYRYTQTLKRIGIDARVRTVDPAQYIDLEGSSPPEAVGEIRFDYDPLWMP